MSLIVERAQLALKAEASEGSAETLTAGEAVVVMNPKFEPVVEPGQRSLVSSSLSPFPALMGRRMARLSFQMELAGGSAAGLAAPFSTALMACGVSQALVTDTSATYAPASDSIPSLTLGLFLDGKLYKLWGARGTAKIELAAGKPGLISFQFTGADWTETDTALLSGVSYPSVSPPVFLSASLSVNAYAATVSSVELDLGAKVQLRADANAASGYKSAVITGRNPTLTLDPENVLAATHDFLGAWRAGTQMAFSATLGAAPGNTIAITAPRLQYQKAGLGDRDGLSAFELTGLLCRQNGDDEWRVQIS